MSILFYVTGIVDGLYQWYILIDSSNSSETKTFVIINVTYTQAFQELLVILK